MFFLNKQSNNYWYIFFQLIDTQEHHPLSFSPLMQPSFELCYNYLFTSQGQGEFQEKGLTAFTMKQ